MAGHTIKEIAEAYVKSESTISRLINGHSYQNVIEMEGVPDLPKSPQQEAAERREFLRMRGL